MSERHFHLDQLSPTEALQVLAETVPKVNLRSLLDISLLISHSAFGREIALVVPDARSAARGGRIERNASVKAFDTLIESYKQIKGINPTISSGHSREAPLPLPKGVPLLLLYSDEGEEFALANEKEYLLIGRNIDAKRAAQVVEDLRFHATQTRVSAAETEAGTRYLFHVLDDDERGSSFLSLQAAQFFPEGSILSCFVSHQSLVFLPQDIKPGRRALTHFCRLLQAAPSLFNAQPGSSEHNLLVALDQVEFFYLAGLTFYSQISVTPPADEYADFKFFDLRTSQRALNQLNAAIAEAEPYVGYRLELRLTKMREPIEAERQRLLNQQVEVEYQLAYLNSIARPRPRLLRFTQKQLPALADVIRSLPGRVIRQGLLKYGFQATPDEPAGLHFIYIEPQNAGTNELDPLLRWDNQKNRPIRFWLDPFWARYYHGTRNQCLLFVPEGTALFPSMHGWDVASMDTYMREMMEHWFHGHHGVDNIPDQPIYIFEGEPHPTAKINISVLDFDKFQPLDKRLGWINQNLVIIDNLGIENLIEQMAQDITRRELATHIRQQANEAQSDFEQIAQKTNQAIADKVGQLTQALTEELRRLIDESQKQTDAMRTLNRRLQRLKAVYRGMRIPSEQADWLIKETQKGVEAAQEMTLNLGQQVDSTLKEAEQTRYQMRQKIEAEIRALQDSREDLRRRLRNL